MDQARQQLRLALAESPQQQESLNLLKTIEEQEKKSQASPASPPSP